MDHGGHSMPMRCSMNMLWNTQIENTCVVFRQWHIYTKGQFVLSFVAIVALGVLYEWLREFQKTLDRRIALSLAQQGKGKARVSGRSTPEAEREETGLLSGRLVILALFSALSHCRTPVPPLSRILRAATYGLTVFLSFFLMLVFMTYNAYLVLAVVLGAAVGNYVFSSHMDVDSVLSGTSAGKGMACH
ncbi:Ctr copper transporter [Neolentinus lepideus HHB14362 ss-1]|uniref:Copper transport protein n=1 Tax=Neolentinus lepideus HHB14362 ss-1 TaxID=1314782 RepID=A0A165V4B1_9AGAM|nr:Ctr copper transporter [Neolentinus lepideus HHB14362 ss-1]